MAQLKSGTTISDQTALHEGNHSHSDINEFISSKGSPNGLASLNEQGKVPNSQLPEISGGSTAFDHVVKDDASFSDLFDQVEPGKYKIKDSITSAYIADGNYSAISLLQAFDDLNTDVQEKISVGFIDDDSGALGGSYFNISTLDNDHYVWYNIPAGQNIKIVDQCDAFDSWSLSSAATLSLQGHDAGNAIGITKSTATSIELWNEYTTFKFDENDILKISFYFADRIKNILSDSAMKIELKAPDESSGTEDFCEWTILKDDIVTNAWNEYELSFNDAVKSGEHSEGKQIKISMYTPDENYIWTDAEVMFDDIIIDYGYYPGAVDPAPAGRMPIEVALELDDTRQAIGTKTSIILNGTGDFDAGYNQIDKLICNGNSISNWEGKVQLSDTVSGRNGISLFNESHEFFGNVIMTGKIFNESVDFNDFLNLKLSIYINSQSVLDLINDPLYILFTDSEGGTAYFTIEKTELQSSIGSWIDLTIISDDLAMNELKNHNISQMAILAFVSGDLILNDFIVDDISVEYEKFIITCSSGGNVRDSFDGNTGFEISIDTQGLPECDIAGDTSISVVQEKNVHLDWSGVMGNGPLLFLSNSIYDYIVYDQNSFNQLFKKERDCVYALREGITSIHYQNGLYSIKGLMESNDDYSEPIKFIDTGDSLDGWTASTGTSLDIYTEDAYKYTEGNGALNIKKDGTPTELSVVKNFTSLSFNTNETIATRIYLHYSAAWYGLEEIKISLGSDENNYYTWNFDRDLIESYENIFHTQFGTHDEIQGNPGIAISYYKIRFGLRDINNISDDYILLDYCKYSSISSCEFSTSNDQWCSTSPDVVFDWSGVQCRPFKIKCNDSLADNYDYVISTQEEFDSLFGSYVGDIESGWYTGKLGGYNLPGVEVPDGTSIFLKNKNEPYILKNGVQLSSNVSIKSDGAVVERDPSDEVSTYENSVIRFFTTYKSTYAIVSIGDELSYKYSFELSSEEEASKFSVGDVVFCDIDNSYYKISDISERKLIVDNEITGEFTANHSLYLMTNNINLEGWTCTGFHVSSGGHEYKKGGAFHIPYCGDSKYLIEVTDCGVFEDGGAYYGANRTFNLVIENISHCSGGGGNGGACSGIDYSIIRNISYCHAGDGGACYDCNYSTISNISFCYTHSEGSSFGGGGCCKCDNSIISNVRHCDAGMRGGGVSHCNSSVITDIRNCTAGHNGGGCYECNNSIIKGVYNCSVSGTWTDDGGGGCSHCDDSEISHIHECSAIKNGGGCYYCNNSILSLIGNCKTDGNGGGCYLCYNSTITQVKECEAGAEGGGCYSCNGSTISYLTGCNAVTNGGGCSQCDGSLISYISSCTAGTSGSGCYECQNCHFSGVLNQGSSGDILNNCTGTAIAYSSNTSSSNNLILNSYTDPINWPV